MCMIIAFSLINSLERAVSNAFKTGAVFHRPVSNADCPDSNVFLVWFRTSAVMNGSHVCHVP